MAKGTDVAKAKTTDVGAPMDYGEFQHEGFEDTTINDLSIPFLNIVQTNSEILEAATIPDLKAGDLWNSVTQEIMKQPVVVQPVHKEEVWVEWVPRTKGGGLVDRHAPDSECVRSILAKNNNSRIPPKDAEGKRPPFKQPNGNGNDVVETYYIYCLIMDPTGAEVEGYCVLSFSSTKIRVQKDWTTAMYTQKGRPPMFANRAAVSTVRQKAEGGSFYNFHIGPMADTWRASLIVPDEAGMVMLKEAKDFREMILSGLAKPDFDSMAKEGDPDTRAAKGGAAPKGPSAESGSDDVPF